jgi:hypothetical protein
MILKQVLLLVSLVRIGNALFPSKNVFLGFPNVGSQACETGSMPGITK